MLYRINIIDTPGHVDFTAEVQRSLRVLDGAVMIFDSRHGVEPQSETVWRQANDYGVPRICFVNKLSLIGADFLMSLGTIKERLSKKAVAVSLPIGRESEHRGMIDLIEMKAYTYKNIEDIDVIEEEIPADMLEMANKYRAELLDRIVEQDDALMEKYLAGEEISVDELKKAMRKGVIANEIYPVTGGDSRTPIVKRLLNMVIEYLPSPLDIPAVKGIHPKTGEEVERKADENEPFSALVFKLVNDEHIGTLSYFRVYSGKIKSGVYAYNSTKNIKERVSRLVLMHADQREEVDELRAGDIGAIVGLKDTDTGNTICDESKPVVLEQIKFAEPVVSQAIEPASKSDQEKLGMFLARLMKEDPTFKVFTNHETGQTIMSGMGELHLDIIVDRLKREFGVNANVGEPQVAYRETITAVREQEGRYVKQSGGKGQYGHCWLRLEPNPGKGYEFNDEVRGGVVPKEYIPSIEKGVKESLLSGVIAGYPVVDIKVTVYDGSYHEVDSSDAAFKVAGSMAFKDGCRNANPVLLEPIMLLEVSVPQEFMGDVTGQISSKRGRIEKTEIKGNVQVVTAKVPLAELFGFTTLLRSITSGRGSAYMEMSHYEQVPKNIVEQMKK